MIYCGPTQIDRADRGAVLRVGFLPGSFDPPHRGHLELAERARVAMRLDRVYFYPNSLNAFKPGLSPLHHRRAMIGLTIDGDFMRLMPAAICDMNLAPDPDHDFTGEMARLAAYVGMRCKVVMVRGSDYFHPHLVHRYPAALRMVPHIIGIRDRAHRSYDFSGLANAAFVECDALSSTEVRHGYCQPGSRRDDSEPLERYWRHHGLYT